MVEADGGPGWSVFIWLLARRWRNRFRLWLKVALKPASLLAYLGIIAWICSVFVFGHNEKSVADVAGKYCDAAQLNANLLLVGLVASTALFLYGALQRGGILYMNGDVNYLFPAPLARRRVLHYKILHNAFINLLFFLPFSLFMACFYYRMIGGLTQPLWIFFPAFMFGGMLYTQHIALLSMLLTLYFQRDTRGYAHRRGGLTALLLYVAGNILLIAYSAYRFGRDGGIWLQALVAVLNGPAFTLLNFPLVMVRDVMLCRGGAVWLAGETLALLGLLGLEYYWAGRVAVNYYEAAAAVSERAHQVVLAIKQYGPLSAEVRAVNAQYAARKKKRPRALPWCGLRGAGCLLWRDMRVLLASWMAWICLFLFPLLALIIVLAVPVKGRLGALGGLMFYLFMLSRMMPSQMQLSVAHVQNLKVLPFSATRLMLAEILSPTLLLSISVGACLLIAMGGQALPPDIGAALLLLAPMGIFMHFGVSKFIAYKFPPHATSKVIQGTMQAISPMLSVVCLALCTLLWWNFWLGLALVPALYLLIDAYIVMLAGWAFNGYDAAAASSYGGN